MPRARIFGWAAAGLSALWFGVHTFVGGPLVATPLLASDLPETVRVTGWMVWHMVTGVLALLAVLYGWAIWRQSPDMMIAATALSAVVAAAGIAAAMTSGAGVLVIPQGFLFILGAVLGWLSWRGIRADGGGTAP